MKSKSGSILSILGNNRLLAGLLVLLAIVISTSVFLFFSLNADSRHDAEYVQHADELRVSSQTFPRSAIASS